MAIVGSSLLAELQEKVEERRARQQQAIEERRYATLTIDPQLVLGLFSAQENFATRTSFRFEGMPDDVVAVAVFTDPSFWGIQIRVASMTFEPVPINEHCPMLNVLVHASTRGFLIEQTAGHLLDALAGRFRPDEVREAEDALREALLPPKDKE